MWNINQNCQKAAISYIKSLANRYMWLRGWPLGALLDGFTQILTALEVGAIHPALHYNPGFLQKND